MIQACFVCTQFPASPWSWNVAGGPIEILRSIDSRSRKWELGKSVLCEGQLMLCALIDLVICSYRTGCRNGSPVYLARQAPNGYHIMRRKLLCFLHSAGVSPSRALAYPFRYRIPSTPQWQRSAQFSPKLHQLSAGRRWSGISCCSVIMRARMCIADKMLQTPDYGRPDKKLSPVALLERNVCRE
jgi:hypothetical protein